MVDEKELRASIAEALDAVRRENPLAGSVTNGVTMDFVANAQIAVGGSAAMVYLPDEAETLVAAGGALYINMGTLMPISGETITRAAQALAAAGKPWTLDPVGIGIGELRTQTLLAIKDCKPSIVRSNASEIIALAGLWGLSGGGDLGRARGVDSIDEVISARAAAVALAQFTGGAVAVSGVTDLVTDGSTLVYAAGGSPFMEKITGAGCSLGGVCAVYAAVTDAFTAALTGVAIFNLAGTRAERMARGPASFKVAFLDELAAATAEDLIKSDLVIEAV